MPTPVTSNQLGYCKRSGVFAELTTAIISVTAPVVRVPQIYKALGQAVSTLRRKSGLTQQELADAIGISRASVANIERGEQRVFFDQVASIAAYFSLNGIDTLLSFAHTEEAPVKGKVHLSGGRLKRNLKREVHDLLEELITAEN